MTHEAGGQFDSHQPGGVILAAHLLAAAIETTVLFGYVASTRAGEMVNTIRTKQVAAAPDIGRSAVGNITPVTPVPITNFTIVSGI